MKTRAPGGCLGYIGDYTAQFCGDYHKTMIRIPIKTTRIQWKGRVFLVAHRRPNSQVSPRGRTFTLRQVHGIAYLRSLFLLFLRKLGWIVLKVGDLWFQFTPPKKKRYNCTTKPKRQPTWTNIPGNNKQSFFWKKSHPIEPIRNSKGPNKVGFVLASGRIQMDAHRITGSQDNPHGLVS